MASATSRKWHRCARRTSRSSSPVRSPAAYWWTGFEHPEPGGVGVLGVRQHQRVLDEGLEPLQDPVRTRDRLDGVQGEPVDERGEHPEQPLLVVREQLVAPVDGRSHRPLPWRQVAGAASGDDLVEPLQDRARGEEPGPRGRQLQRERDAREAATDRRDRLGVAVVDDEARSHRAGPVEEQRRGRRGRTPADSGWAAPGSGRPSGASWYCSSPRRRSGVRLVTRTVRPGHEATSLPMPAAASGRCSALSSTTSSSRCRRCSATAAAGSGPSADGRPVARPIGGQDGRRVGQRGQRDDGDSVAEPAAGRLGDGVGQPGFPTPPTPVIVTSRSAESASSRSTYSTSRLRPCSAVGGTTTSELQVPAPAGNGSAVAASGASPASPAPAGGRRRAQQAVVLLEDPLVQRLQLGPRVQPELLGEDATAVAVHVERLGLAAGAVERQHQEAAERLPQRVPGDQRGEPGRAPARSGPGRGRAPAACSWAASRNPSRRAASASANGCGTSA